MVGSVTSAGAGIDIHGMARRMATLQTQPKANQLSRKESGINAEVKALNELSDALDDFYKALDKLSKPVNFGSLKVNLSEDDKKSVAVSADHNALPNTYQLQVDHLATQHKIQVFSSESGSNEVKTSDAGKYSFAIGDKTLEIDIEKGDTLADIAHRINDSDDNPGATASIVSDGNYTYLTMTSRETGADNAIKVVRDAKEVALPQPGDTDFDSSGYKVLQVARDAEFFLDGIRLNSSDNKVDDVIKGVTLNLKKKTEETIRFDINPDTSTMKDSGKDMADELNDLFKVINKLSKVSVDGKTGSRTRGPLASDSIISSIRNDLRKVLQKESDGPYSTLAAVGIVTDRDGDLEVDSSKLKDALEKDPKEVTRLFMSAMKGFKDVATKYIGRPESGDDDKDDKDDKDTDTDGDSGTKPYIPKEGIIDVRIKGLNEDLRGIRDDRQDVQERFQSVFQRYLNEFVAMNKAVDRMRSSMAGLL